MGYVGIALGIIAAIAVGIPVGIGGVVASFCIAVGLPLSGVALYRKARSGEGKKTAIAGLATNEIALAALVLWGDGGLGHR